MVKIHFLKYNKNNRIAWYVVYKGVTLVLCTIIHFYVGISDTHYYTIK